MKLKITRFSLQIEPEGILDETFIEAVLGLNDDGDMTICRRVNAYSFGVLGHLEILPKNQKNQITMTITSGRTYSTGEE